MRGWKKVFHTNGNQEEATVAIFVSDKIDFKIKTVTRDKDVHNDPGINPRRYNNSKYICSQHRRTSIYTANINRHRRRN